MGSEINWDGIKYIYALLLKHKCRIDNSFLGEKSPIVLIVDYIGEIKAQVYLGDPISVRGFRKL